MSLELLLFLLYCKLPLLNCDYFSGLIRLKPSMLLSVLLVVYNEITLNLEEFIELDIEKLFERGIIVLLERILCFDKVDPS